MKFRTLLGIAAALAVVVVLGLRAEESGKVKLIGKNGDVVKLIEADTDELNKTLSPAKPDKKDLKRAKVLAVVIGLNAQALGSGNAEAAAMHEQAGKVLAALNKDDGLAEAKEAAKALKTAKAGTGATVDLVKGLFDEDPTVKDWDRDLVMQLFKTTRAGGLGIESKIKSWSEKAPAGGKDMDLAANYAQKSAVIGMALQRMTAPKGKPAAAWQKLAKDMQVASEEAMEAAAKKDGKALMIAFGRVDKACTICHEQYK